MGVKMRTRDYNNYYRTCDIGDMSIKDKKRYELLNDYGYNFFSNKKRYVDLDKEASQTQNNVNASYIGKKR